MQAPPFRLARTADASNANDGAGARLRVADACCAPPSPGQIATSKRRTKLTELDPHLHCSVIGTCLTTHELRKLVPKFTALDRQHASDLEIHHAAVELAIAGGAGSKALHKALDERYAGAVRRFDQARDEEALLALWNESLKNGDIPPAYWALMTHPYATMPVRQAAFGELHMLSHLVGAANRADIRRLVALEEENAELRDKVERQQNRLHEISTQRDATVAQLSEQVVKLTAQARPQLPVDTASLAEEVKALQEKLAEANERLALHTSRREAAEQRALQEQGTAEALRESRDQALALLKAVQSECHALERATLDALDEPDTRRAGLAGVQGKRVVYVGGRPGSNTALKALVSSAGGELVVHDGGVEDRKGLLAAALPGADLVVFPVDCIDHDSMTMLKRVCERHQVDYHPLRTASVASFIDLITRLHTDRTDLQSAAPSSRPPSAFCLRHG
jgi:outer membrane murein-binding lipoprotein Lpp